MGISVHGALTADRPYRKAMAVHTAFEIMARDVGKVIDPAVFAALQRGFERIETVASPEEKAA